MNLNRSLNDYEDLIESQKRELSTLRRQTIVSGKSVHSQVKHAEEVESLVNDNYELLRRVTNDYEDLLKKNLDLEKHFQEIYQENESLYSQIRILQAKNTQTALY